MQYGKAMLCNLSMPNAIGLKYAHKTKVASMPNAMQPKHAI